MAEFCELKSYRKTSRGLQFEKKRKLFDDFIRFKKEAKKPKLPSGLSFEVQNKLLFCFLYLSLQINLSREDDKVSTKVSKAVLSKRARTSKTKKEAIPKPFVDHIRKLGFRDSDANVLYENKDDWIGVSTGKLRLQYSTVQCSERNLV